MIVGHGTAPVGHGASRVARGNVSEALVCSIISEGMQQGDGPIKGSAYRLSAAVCEVDSTEALRRRMVMVLFLSGCRCSKQQKNRKNRNAPRHCRLPTREFRF